MTSGGSPLQLSLGVEPAHGNRNLFSDHYLDVLLQSDPRWQAAQAQAASFLAWLQERYANEREHLPSYNETQLEDHWFRPILERLGHTYERQASVPGLGEGIKRPDFVFFPDESARQAAAAAQRSEEYAKEALALGEVKAWDVPLGKKARGGSPRFDDQNPSYQIDYYLKTTGLDWGILSNGRHWRLVHRESSQRLTIYYEVDLIELLERGEAGPLRYFTLFFRQAALRPDDQGRVFLDDALQASSDYALALEEDLQENVYRALEQLMQGFVDLPQNGLGGGDLRAARLRDVYDNSLHLLYRLLFIFYAESRGLLPLQNREYREHYSLGDLAREIARDNAPTAPMTVRNWGHLQTLFHIINGDDEGLNRHLGVPRYNGGLFNPDLHPFLEEMAVGDGALVRAVDLLARRRTEAGREFVDYRTLGVRQLGSIYEGLLEYQPRLAEEEMVAVRQGGEEKWLRASEAPDDARITARAPAGRIYLATDRGERKATGSYYTPEYIVEYIVDNTLGPLVQEARERVVQRGQEALTKAAKEAAAQSLVDEILALKALDPAMGSGHFLVAATDYLALELATDPYVETEATPEEDVVYWRRRVVERCIYGVDKNPLAVELAKLSLWLNTVAADQPLSFLDHHLKCGDSLVGAEVADLGWAPPAILTKKQAQRQEAQKEAGQMDLFSQRLGEQLPNMMLSIFDIMRRESDSYESVQEKEAADRTVRQLKAPFEAVADLWTSAYFGHEFTPEQYAQALEQIGRPTRLLAQPAVQQALALSRPDWREVLRLWHVPPAGEVQPDGPPRRFFHWELAFPEVFYDENGQRLGERAGFDAVVGNPPYVSAWSMIEESSGDRDAITQLVDPSGVLAGHWDLYTAFLVRSYELTRRQGWLSFILPNPFCREKYALGLRKFFLENTHIQRLVSFGEQNVFDEVSRQTIIPVFSKSTPDLASTSVLIENPLKLVGRALEDGYKIPQGFFYQLPEYQFRFAGKPEKLSILSKVDEQSYPLGNSCYVNYGAQVSSKEKGKFGKEDVVFDSPYGNAKRFIDGKNLARYEITWDGRYLDYRPDEMYGPRAPELFENPKILIRDVTGANEQLIVSYDDSGLYCDHLLICATYYEYLADTDLRTKFEGYERTPLPHPTLHYLTGLLASKLNTWYFREIFATGTLQGSYSHTYPQQIRAFPIFQIEFATSTADRQRLLEKGRKLYDRYCEKDDLDCVTGFVEHELEEGRSDVVHDLLAFLAEEMIEMNRQKQQVVEDFWLDLEGAADPDSFGTLRNRGKWESSLWKDPACRPFVAEESRSTRHLDESLGWNEEAFKAFVKMLAGSVANLSDLVLVYRKHHPRYHDLLDRLTRTDALIDQVVYRLYGLTEEEIAIVEGNNS